MVRPGLAVPVRTGFFTSMTPEQEAEEAKAKLEQLRRVLTGTATTVNSAPPLSPGIDKSASFSYFPSVTSSATSTPSSTGGGGGGWFGGGWGKKTVGVDR